MIDGTSEPENGRQESVEPLQLLMVVVGCQRDKVCHKTNKQGINESRVRETEREKADRLVGKLLEGKKGIL